MKLKETKLDKNISRLVKLTRDSDIPSEKFVDSLINDALKELDQPQHDHKRAERNSTMKLTLKKTLAAAAVLIITAGIFSLLKTDAFDQPTKYTKIDISEPAVPAGQVAIPLVLPSAQFSGTPQDIKVENLEKPLGHPRPPFMAPAGTVNVALNKPVASSDEFPIIGEIELITDGDRDAADGSFVELGPGVQNVTIDLGAKYNIYAVVAWHYHKQARVYFDIVMQTADDADFTVNVQSIFNNDIDNSAGIGVGKGMHYVETNEGKLIDAKGVQGRYLRMYSNGSSSSDFNHYIEIEVYGKPIE
jgi:hypothetical protein